MFWVLTPIGLIRQVQSEEHAALAAGSYPHCIYFEAEFAA